LGAWLVVLAAIAPAWGQQTDPGQQVAAAGPADSESVARPALKQMLSAGFSKARDGRFAEAMVQFRQVQKVSPNEPVARRAGQLLGSYLTDLETFEQQRRREYRRAVERIRRCMMADREQAKLDADWLESLREIVPEKLNDAYEDVATTESLADATDGEASDIRSRTVEALASSAEIVNEALAMTEGKQGVWVETFRRLADTYLQVERDYLAAWRSAEIATPDARKEAAWQLRSKEEALADALVDLETLVAEKPWRIALVQAAGAKDLAPEDIDVTGQGWYTQLVDSTQQRGKTFSREAKWRDALSAFAGLEDIDPDNAFFAEQAKVVRRHVRVLRLYGEEDEEDSESDGDEVDDIDQDEPTWRDLVEGVDPEMVKRVISRLAQAYVTAVDFREVTRGGLQSVLVLAETPQAADSFPGLKDDRQRERFIHAIRSTLENIEKKDRVDNLDLQLALNTVLLVSDRTVGIPTEVLAYEFTDGFLEELDKFSSMIWPYDYEDFTKQTMGRFFGVGIQITKKEGEPLRVVTPLPGSPAFKAGVKTNDLIVKVDGRKTENRSLDKLVRLITGPKGTKVTLTIEREGLRKEFDVDIVRDQINIRTVKGWRRKADGDWDYMLDRQYGIGYIRVTQFTGTTHSHLVEAIEQLRSEGMNSLIIDLRFNPGGLLRSATDVADEFISKGALVSTRGRQTPRSVAQASPLGSYQEGELVVLVNEFSASAAEILSGAVKDWHRATIVGVRTYGKGSVQNVIAVRRNKALLKLTTAYYYLPSGRLLHRKNGSASWGVDPDVEVYITPRQMKRWLDIRRKTDLVQEISAGQLSKDLARQYVADVQLNAGVLLLKLKALQNGELTSLTLQDARSN
jgi:carboxyl-terminal processing protease